MISRKLQTISFTKEQLIINRVQSNGIDETIGIKQITDNRISIPCPVYGMSTDKISE